MLVQLVNSSRAKKVKKTNPMCLIKQYLSQTGFKSELGKAKFMGGRAASFYVYV